MNLLRRIIAWIVCLFTAHDCSKHGHAYFARYDDMIDPRLTSNQLYEQLSPIRASYLHHARTEIYIRDICKYCGDVIERAEGLSALEILARQAKKIA